MKKLIIKLSIIILAVTVVITGCQKWLDIDYNPDEITRSPAINEGICPQVLRQNGHNRP